MENTENVINENSESSKVKKPYKRPQNRNYNKRPKMTATNNENTTKPDNTVTHDPTHEVDEH